MPLYHVPALAAAEGQTFPVAAEWRCVHVHGGSDWEYRYRRRPPSVAGASDSPLRENQASSAPIANKGRFNLAPLNQLVLGSSAGAKQFLEWGTDRNIRKLDDRGPQRSAQPFDCSRIAALLSEWQQPI